MSKRYLGIYSKKNLKPTNKQQKENRNKTKNALAALLKMDLGEDSARVSPALSRALFTSICPSAHGLNLSEEVWDVCSNQQGKKQNLPK